MQRFIVFAVVFCLPAAANAAYVSTFEDLGLPANSFNNNAGPSGFFVSGGNSFNNQYSSSYGGVWSGWAVSSTTDAATPGYTNQYSAITGSGANGSQTYAVAFTYGPGSSTDPEHPSDSFVNLVPGTHPTSIQITNTTYAYLSMMNGDQVAHKFGPGDFFLLTISGYNALNGTGAKVGEVDYYLANFQGKNDYIVNTWQTINLGSLSGAKSLVFGLESSDNNPVYGMNTPAYFAADNLTVSATPEPSSWALLAIGGAGLGCNWFRRKSRPTN